MPRTVGAATSFPFNLQKKRPHKGGRWNNPFRPGVLKGYSGAPALRIAPFLSAMCPPSYTTPATLVLLSTRGQKPGGEVTTSLKFHVNEADNDLVVTIVGTAYMVRYRRADTGLKLFHSRGDERAAIHGAQFLARAGQLANRRAEELGWFSPSSPTANAT